MSDSPKTARRREREKRTVSQMICLYCKKNHDAALRTHAAYCGELVCESCLAIDGYAVKRTELCRSMDHKTTCEQCGRHCYKPEEREKIREVMRFSGPRMLMCHPVAAVRHLFGI